MGNCHHRAATFIYSFTGVLSHRLLETGCSGGQGLAWAGMVLSSPARHWGAVGGKRWLAAGLAGTVSTSWGELCA